MSVANHFHIIGTCYGDCKKTLTKSSRPLDRKYIATFTLMVESSFTNNKQNFIPIVAIHNLAEKCGIWCRNGNKVVCDGEITSFEYLDTQTGVTRIRTTFIATEVKVITKAERKLVTGRSFAELLDKVSIDEFKAPTKKGN